MNGNATEELKAAKQLRLIETYHTILGDILLIISLKANKMCPKVEHLKPPLLA